MSGQLRTDAPIGVFDSGFGGLTVARAIVDLLPHEDVVYLGDTEHAPYGDRPLPEVRAFALEGLDRLVDEGVKALVIACNSASSAVLRDARERYDVPVIDVVLPAARRAALATRTGRIGLICTAATALSGAYDDALDANPTVTLATQACPAFVGYVERGITGGDELMAAARGYLESLQRADVDTLILGCTHYPLLAGVISLVMGDEVTLVSSAEECARETYRRLSALSLVHNQPREVRRRFLTTGSPERFQRIGERLLAGFIADVEPA